MRLKWKRRLLLWEAVGQSVTWCILPATEAENAYDVFVRDEHGRLQELGLHQFPSVRQAKRYCQEQEEKEATLHQPKPQANGGDMSEPIKCPDMRFKFAPGEPYGACKL